jgi:hypothetical protein
MAPLDQRTNEEVAPNTSYIDLIMVYLLFVGIPFLILALKRGEHWVIFTLRM